MDRVLEYSVLDVFAERALEGNQLAVFHDGRGLTDAEMQAVARETNLSETVFVLPEEDESAGVRMRIFTTEEELPFAGHPTLGTAAWVWGTHPRFRGTEKVVLLQKAGAITVTFPPGLKPLDFGEGLDGGAEAPFGEDPRGGLKPTSTPERFAGVVGTMRQKDPLFGDVWEAEEVAGVIGIDAGDLWPEFLSQTVSTGNPFCIVGLKDVATLERLKINQATADPWLKERGIRWFYCVAPVGDGTFRARMQFYGGEDPATGSAAGPCVAWLVRNGLAPADTEIVIRQGVEMKRPSVILGRAALLHGNRVHSIDIGGRTIPVAEGRYFLPG